MSRAHSARVPTAIGRGKVLAGIERARDIWWQYTNNEKRDTNMLDLKALQANDYGNNYDWQQVFEYAGDEEHDCGHYGSLCISACFGAEGVSTQPVLRRNVTRIVASAEGENDGADWLIVVELIDGRVAFLCAGCDYTGWDCQASGHCIVSNDLAHLIRFGLGEDHRSRLGLPL